MQCPIDGETLMIADRQGVEIDYCPKCRGIWLDRGELDKIIELSANDRRGMASYDAKPEYYNSRDGKKKHKKRDGFLDELFDFF